MKKHSNLIGGTLLHACAEWNVAAATFVAVTLRDALRSPHLNYVILAVDLRHGAARAFAERVVCEIDPAMTLTQAADLLEDSESYVVGVTREVFARSPLRPVSDPCNGLVPYVVIVGDDRRGLLVRELSIWIPRREDVSVSV